MREQRLMWLWLYRVMGPCNHRWRELLRHFDYIDEIYDSRDGDFLAKNLTPQEYKNARTVTLASCNKLLERCDEKGISVICYCDEAYPQKLRDTRIPPILLFATGDVSALTDNSVAGVGSRVPTPYGREAVKHVCIPLSRAGFTLVSGLAYGIDADVHKAALSSGGRTVAVLGNAIDMTYPKSHAALRNEIEKNGAVVSEYEPGAELGRFMFPQRNRIISGLSRGVIIFEAAKKSGTMITANYALDDGRDVFAVPGSILSDKSEGTNHLIKQGAIPVSNALDVLAALGVDAPAELFERVLAKSAERKFTGAQKRITDALRGGELSVDDLLDKSGLPAHELFANLTELEIDAAVEALPGSMYRLK